jgi:hypothetical protein
MKTDLKEIAKSLNNKSQKYHIGKLQEIRKELKDLSKKPTSDIFVDNPNTMTEEWAYHYGGRSEIQFNIGLEGKYLRYGLAFSLETSQTLPNIDLLKPKIKKLNEIIQKNPELFSNFKMWSWYKNKRTQINQVEKIRPEHIKNGNFIFFGKLMELEAINYEEILQTFDKMLEIYTQIEKSEKIINPTSQKVCILKPIMWNSKNYTEPSGHKSASGFSKDYGYGHEEWNNNTKWTWRNYKIFHTESKPKLLEYSKNGNLSIIMIVAIDNVQYAVGIATNVYHNDSEERELISKELNLYENYNVVWEQDTVKKAFNNEKEDFITHWNKNYSWVQWKCPAENYLWFNNPVPLNPKKITGKDKLITMHGSYQRILPQNILDTLKNELRESPQIIEWLTEGEFNNEWVTDKGKIVSNTKLKNKYNKQGANAPTQNSFSYWVQGRRNIEPLHAKLQAKFVDFLKKQNILIKEDDKYIDVQYTTTQNETYFCEIKPTENIETKYAIRIAIGQLLEYQHFHNKNAKLEIVLSSQPRKKEIEFLKSLKIKLTYFDDLTNEFVTV